jgi:phosphoglycerate dehydrogenase-like enzyme
MMHAVLIIGEDSQEFAALLEQQSEPKLTVTAVEEADMAVAVYSGQAILFGDPLSISKVLPHLPDVKWVQSTWAGVTPLLTLERRDYLLTGIKGVFGPQMSEYVLGYMLAHELRIQRRSADQLERNWKPTASGSLPGKTIGVMGAGSIGEAIANRASKNGMVAIGLSRSGDPVAAFETVFPASELHQFLHGLDYLVSVLPDTAATDGLLDADALARLPSHAVFINVGRSNVVDDGALVDALTNGELAGAVLDVFDEEPLPAASPLWSTPNLIATPHIAAVSYPELIVPIFLENYRRFIAGKALVNQISFERGY